MTQEDKDYKWQLSKVCSVLSRKIGLTEKGLHIAALFQDNDHDDVIGWAVCDSNNNIVKQYDDLISLSKDCKDYDI